MKLKVIIVLRFLKILNLTVKQLNQKNLSIFYACVMIIFITISIKSKKWRDDCAFYFSLNINNSLDIMLLFEETQILHFNARHISSETSNKSSSSLCLILYGWEVQAWEMAKLLKKRQSHLACIYVSWLRAHIYLSLIPVALKRKT